MLYLWKKGAVAKRTAQELFARFEPGDFNLDDQKCQGRTSITDEIRLKH